MRIVARERDKYGYSYDSAEFTRLRNIFQSVVSGHNGMTPYLVGYVELMNGVAEITEVTPLDEFLTGKMYGVTIVLDGKKSPESCAVFSLTEASSLLSKFMQNEKPLH